MDLSHSSYSRPWFLHDEYRTSGDRWDNRQNHWFGTWSRMWQRGRFSYWCFYTLHDNSTNWAQFKNLTKQCTRMRFNETLLHDSAKTQTRAIAKNTMLIPGTEYHFMFDVEFWNQKMWNLIAYLLVYLKSGRMFTYLNANANDFHLLRTQLRKIPEFNLFIAFWTYDWSPFCVRRILIRE